MGVTNSPVDVCNLALERLGEGTISSLTQTGSTEAAECNRFYDQARRECLEGFEWSFAVKRQELAQLSSIGDSYGDWDYEYGYQLPNDCLRLIEVYPIETPYDIEQDRVIYISSTKVHARYVADVEDVTKWSPWFITALSLRLASLISTPLQGKNGMYNTVLGEYFVAYDTAKAHDADHKKEPPSTVDTWVTP